MTTVSSNCFEVGRGAWYWGALKLQVIRYLGLRMPEKPTQCQVRGGGESEGVRPLDSPLPADNKEEKFGS